MLGIYSTLINICSPFTSTVFSHVYIPAFIYCILIPLLPAWHVFPIILIDLAPSFSKCKSITFHLYKCFPGHQSKTMLPSSEVSEPLFSALLTWHLLLTMAGSFPNFTCLFPSSPVISSSRAGTILYKCVFNIVAKLVLFYIVNFQFTTKTALLPATLLRGGKPFGPCGCSVNSGAKGNFHLREE